MSYVLLKKKKKNLLLGVKKSPNVHQVKWLYKIVELYYFEKHYFVGVVDQEKDIEHNLGLHLR